MMYQERKNYAENSEYKPKYIPDLVWSQLIHHWASDKKFRIYQWQTLQIVLPLKVALFILVVLYLWVSMNVGWRKKQESILQWRRYLLNAILKRIRFGLIRELSRPMEILRREKQSFWKYLSQDQDESQHNMSDDLTIWKEVVPKGKKGKLYGSCSNAFKYKSIEEELLKWKEKEKEQELINQEQKQKLEQQQKRIESNESMLVALFGKLNMPLPSNFACATPMQDEPNHIVETSNGNNADNFGFD